MNIFGVTISALNIITWLVFGLIVGAIAHYIDPQDVRGGVLGTIVAGILGAIVGGFLSSAIFGIAVTGFDLTSFVIALAGALIVVYLERLVLRGGSVRTRTR